MTLLQKIIKYAGFMVFTIEKILQILYSMENCSDEFITAEFAGNEMLDLVERLEKSQWMELHEVFKTISNRLLDFGMTDTELYLSHHHRDPVVNAIEEIYYLEPGLWKTAHKISAKILGKKERY